MIVVSDTSPLNYLVLIGAIDVLPQLFGEVLVPPAVMQELQHPRTPEQVKKWAASPPAWLLLHQPQSTIALDSPLDPGEAEAIALAIELHAAAVLLDEKKGRSVAKGRGLVALGTVTVLELAAESELLDLSDAMAALRQTTFYITESLAQSVLDRHAARKQK